jgi:hypothetical protein
MKIYQVDEGYWYAAETGEAAQEAYRQDTDPDGAEFIAEFGPAIEVSDDALDRLKVADVDEPGQPTRTFREALNEAIAAGRGACFIATSEY